jgi:hypothetical protein
MGSAPFPVLVNVCGFRQEESEKGFSLETARLRDSKQTKVVAGALLAECAGDFALNRQVAKRPLGSVIVPRNTVILNEGEQRLLVPLEPLPIPRNRVMHGGLRRDHFSVEAIDPPTVFAQMAALQAEPLNVFENRNQQITEGHDKSLKFLVKRILPKVIIQVSDQMNKAFLLPAGERVVTSIKVGHDSTLERGK